MKDLIDEKLNSDTKFLKPDMNQRSGRELFAVYLQSKLKQMLEYDKKTGHPMIKEVKPVFISKFSKRLINNPDKKILIAMCGASASGKSTICKTIADIAQKLDLPLSIVSTDNYFKDISDLIQKFGNFDNLRDNGYDIDSPDGFQLDILYKDLEELSMGNDIHSPKYLPNGTGISIPKSIPVQSKKIIIVEGTATLFNPVKDIFDIKFYIETNDETRKARFIERAEVERNQDLENAIKHWNYLIGAGEKYINPTRSEADIILNGDIDLEYFSQILTYIYTITNNFELNID